MTIFCKRLCLRCLEGISSGLTDNSIFYILERPIRACLKIHFGGGLCRVETSQLICKANRLTGFYMVCLFAGGISKQTIIQFYYRKYPSKSFFYILIPWWDCRLSACDSTWEWVPLRMFLRVFLFILQKHLSMVAPAVCIPYRIHQQNSCLTLVDSFQFSTYLMKLKLLCINLAVS